MKAIRLSLLLCTGALADQENFLNVALLSLPEKCLAGIPLDARPTLLLKLSGSTGHDPRFDDRLDYPNGYLEYSNDAPHHSVGATSRFWVKLLYRERSNPLVFVHVRGDRSIGERNPPERPEEPIGASFIYEWIGGRWNDVTDSYLPRGDVQGSSLIPQREGQSIRVAPIVREELRDGKGFYWADASAEKELRWTGARFSIIPLGASGASPRIKNAQQGGAGQPATRSESKSEGNDKPQTESEGRSQ